MIYVLLPDVYQLTTWGYGVAASPYFDLNSGYSCLYQDCGEGFKPRWGSKLMYLLALE